MPSTFEQPILTKSDYLHFRDAPLHLWARYHQRDAIKPPSDYDQLLAQQGNEVEQLAEQFLKSHFENSVQFQVPKQQDCFQATADWIADAESRLTLGEIKASTRRDKRHLYDLGFQYLIFREYFAIERIGLVLLNKHYCRGEELSIADLFVVEDVTTEVFTLLDEIEHERRAALSVLTTATPHALDGCLAPKSCSCSNLCFGDLPANSIFTIPALSKKKRKELMDAGVLAAADVPGEFSLSERQQCYVDCVKSGQLQIDVQTIAGQLSQLVYPLYFLDYETYPFAIPSHAGYKPYQQLVFQYSLHTLHADGNLVHTEFLCTEFTDPSTALVEQLRDEIADEGTIIVWNKTFECGRHKEMAERLSAHSTFLLGLNERVFDMMELFRNQQYLDHRFEGSYSIKYVLPVLCPELSYSKLEVQNGTQAMVEWLEMIDKGQCRGKEALLAYCQQDTLAMVKLFAVLCSTY